MKFDKNYILRQVGSSHVVVPVGRACRDFQGVIELNETAAFLWKALVGGAEPEEAARLLQAEYEVTARDAEKAVSQVLEQMKELGICHG